MGGGLTLRIFLGSKRLLDLPDLEIFWIWTFSMGKNKFLPKCLFLLKNDFWTMLFYFFFQNRWVGGKFYTFLFFIFDTFPYLKNRYLNTPSCHCHLCFRLIAPFKSSDSKYSSSKQARLQPPTPSLH